MVKIDISNRVLIAGAVVLGLIVIGAYAAADDPLGLYTNQTTVYVNSTSGTGDTNITVNTPAINYTVPDINVYVNQTPVVIVVTPAPTSTPTPTVISAPIVTPTPSHNGIQKWGIAYHGVIGRSWFTLTPILQPGSTIEYTMDMTTIAPHVVFNVPAPGNIVIDYAVGLEDWTTQDGITAKASDSTASMAMNGDNVGLYINGAFCYNVLLPLHYVDANGQQSGISYSLDASALSITVQLPASNDAAYPLTITDN